MTADQDETSKKRADIRCPRWFHLVLIPVVGAGTGRSARLSVCLERRPQRGLVIVVLAVIAIAGIVWLVGDRDRPDDDLARDEQAGSPIDTAVQPALPDEPVMRDPILTPPDGVPACRAGDIEFNSGADMGLWFLMFFNRSGQRCSLVDYPALQGRDADGVWRDLPTLRSPGSSYTDGPAWTGSFDPRYTAVLSIRQQAVDSEFGECRELAASGYAELRLVLSSGDDVRLHGVEFEAAHCQGQPRMLLWAYDSTDM